MSLPSLRLKANADRRLRAGHLWVYSNEIDVAATPLNGFAAGDQALLEAAGGKPLGIVAMSPNNLICARLLSSDMPLDKSLLVHRINVALSLRERLFDKPFYRLVFGDSDLLPGLVVDRFGDILVVQLASATMENHKEDIVAALVQVIKPSGILFKNDSAARDAEGLNRYVETVFGLVPEWVALEENGVKFEAPVMAGQKTGWFYDHRMNARAWRRMSKASACWTSTATSAAGHSGSCIWCRRRDLRRCFVFRPRWRGAQCGAERFCRKNDLHRRRRVRSPEGAEGWRRAFRRDRGRPACVHQAQERHEERRRRLPSFERTGHAPAVQGRHSGQRFVLDAPA